MTEAAKAEALRRLGHAWQELEVTMTVHSLGFVTGKLHRSTGAEARIPPHWIAPGRDEAFTNPGRWVSQPTLHGIRDRRDNSQFVEKIILCRSACRRRDPSACDDLLRQARQYCNGNLAHRLDIEYEEAATIMHCASDQESSPQAVPVMRTAVLALRSSDRLGRPYAQARARCALAQALIQSGQARDCLYQLSQAEQILQLLDDSEAQTLSVYLERIRGEALLTLHQYREAVTALELADQRLDQRESWVRAEILVLLGIAHRELRDPVAALAAHATAVEIFRHHHDQPAAEHAFSQLCTTLRAAGFGAYRTWRMRRALLR